MQDDPARVAAGDHVTLKKPHPCGANEWLVVRAGSTMHLQCVGCSRKIELGAAEFARRLAGVNESR